MTDSNSNKPTERLSSKERTHLIICGFIRLFIEAEFALVIPLPIKRICSDFFGYFFSDSAILTSIADQNLMHELLSTRMKLLSTELIYQSITHGCVSQKFYDQCNGKSPTVIIIENEFGNIFGAYTTVKWQSITGTAYKSFEDSNAFVYFLKSIVNAEQKPEIFPVKENKKKDALYIYSSSSGQQYIFHFGSAAAIAIVNKFECKENFCFGAWSYDLKDGHQLCGLNKYSNHSSQQCFFHVKQLEVFVLDNDAVDV